MADLTRRPDVPGTVVCGNCGCRADPAQMLQCPDCGYDLPDPAEPAPPRPAPPPTDLDGTARSSDRITVVVNDSRFTLDDGGTLVLGRDDDLDTEPAFRDNHKVSRFHANLRYADGRLYVTDLKSTNHTFVNGNRLPENVEYEVLPDQSLRLASNMPIELDWDDR